ncbi:MAG: hypothetical protein LBL04_14600, partial [Bacteroidales bacterium]|nr:hypothetical protein [Bacteroidales bacterium]
HKLELMPVCNSGQDKLAGENRKHKATTMEFAFFDRIYRGNLQFFLQKRIIHPGYLCYLCLKSTQMTEMRPVFADQYVSSCPAKSK